MRWFLPSSDIFAELKLHGNAKWLPTSLVCLALCWSVAEARRVIESDENARTRELERLDAELVEIAKAHLELEALAVELAPLATVASEFRRFEELAREEGRRG